MHGRLSDVQRRRRILREIVVSLGASEAMPNPFLAPGDLAKVGLSEDNALKLANPLVAGSRHVEIHCLQPVASHS